MGRIRRIRVWLLLLLVSGWGCSSSGGSHAVPAITAPATTTSTSTTASTTTSIVARSANSGSPPPDTAQPEPRWTGTVTSSSNQAVTDAGKLVCSATWTTALEFTVAADATVTGTATSTLDGTPVCTRPADFPTPMTTLLSNITGTATATQLQLQLNSVSHQPAGSIDATGMSASIYGIDTGPATITIPITSPGHAEGSQQLQTISGVNSFTSDNTITLDCQTC